MYDNAALIGFFKTNLELKFRNNRIFDLDIAAYEETPEIARWTVNGKKNDLDFDVIIEFHPAERKIVVFPANDESLGHTFEDQDEILTRIELFYFNKRFDYFYPQELSDATRNRIILEKVLRICRFVESRLLEGKLKNCNVIWNEVHLMCEFMYEGEIRGVKHNSWFLNLEYYPQLQNLNETWFISCDGMDANDEGFEAEAANLKEAMAIIQSKLDRLPV